MGASNYDKQPTIRVSGDSSVCLTGWAAIAQKLRGRLAGCTRTVVAAECYPGVDTEEISAALAGIADATLISAERALKPADELAEFLAPWLGDDPVFGRMAAWELGSLFDPGKTEQIRSEIASADGVVVVYGTGAAFVAERWDLLVYCDVARWEIQQRERAHKAGNIGADNASATPAALYKRA